LNLLFNVLFELESMFCVILDYNLLHLNESFADLLSHTLTHKITWNFWKFVY
jgi:hypothetical protein